MNDSNEFSQRISGLQSRLATMELDGALLSHPVDIYYFSATRQNGTLWVPATGQPQLLIRKSLSRAREEAQIEQIAPFPSSREFAGCLPNDTRKIGMTFDVLPVQQYHYFAKLLPGCEFSDISMAIRDQRSVKSEAELAIMRRGAETLCGVFAQVPSFLREGMLEIELAAEFEMRLRKAGGEGLVRMRAANQELFLGLAVSGNQACQPGFFDGAVTGRGLSQASPHGASTKPVGRGEPVLIDYTGVFGGYILDMTRMFVIGDLDPTLQQAFACALQIQEQVATGLRPGANCAELFEQAAAAAEDAGLGAQFMGPPGEQAKFVGHGVGLELDELPVLAKGFNTPLQRNQTVAVEPKFVFPGLGVVGIENTYQVGPEGGILLTRHSDALLKL